MMEAIAELGRTLIKTRLAVAFAPKSNFWQTPEEDMMWSKNAGLHVMLQRFITFNSSIAWRIIVVTKFEMEFMIRRKWKWSALSLNDEKKNKTIKSQQGVAWWEMQWNLKGWIFHARRMLFGKAPPGQVWIWRQVKVKKALYKNSLAIRLPTFTLK